MCLLAIKYAAVFNRAVPTPVADRGQRVAANAVGRGPLRQNNRLFGGNPAVSACRHRALRLSDALAHGDEMRVTIESHVNAVRRMPKLIECRIQVEIDARRYPG